MYLDADMMELQRNLSDIHFDYDMSELTDSAQSTLRANSDWLQRPYVSAMIEIEGHCDERGTVEYNQALGERRARAAMDFLTSLGVPESRLRMVSYGKERPQCTDSNEECWMQNRRAHFRITEK